MLPCLIENPAQVYQRRAIEFEGLDGGAAGLSQANNGGEIFVPGEVLAPSLLAGIVYRNDCLANGITSMGVIIFVIVAALTCQSQIFRLAFSTFAFGQDVFDRKLLKGKSCLPEAVLAAATRP